MDVELLRVEWSWRREKIEKTLRVNNKWLMIISSQRQDISEYLKILLVE